MYFRRRELNNVCYDAKFLNVDFSECGTLCIYGIVKVCLCVPMLWFYSMHVEGQQYFVSSSLFVLALSLRGKHEETAKQTEQV